MLRSAMKMMLIGGPTMLIEWHGLRLLTDPTFDPAGGNYPIGPLVLTKTTGPAVSADAIGKIDAVLLSHDHHQDNLDDAGRALLPQAGTVLTTTSGAGRLGGNAVGLEPWATAFLTAPDGARIKITATPGRHGPVGCEPICGDVIGFLLQCEDAPDDDVLYVAGDTVWYEGVAKVAETFRVTVAVLCLGAALLPEIFPDHLTMNAADTLTTLQAFPNALIIPMHYDGWAHWSENRTTVSNALAAAGAGLADRVLWLEPGKLVPIPQPVNS